MSFRQTLKTLAVTGIACCSFWMASAQTATSQSLSGPSTDQQLQELTQQRLQFDSFGWPAKGHFPNNGAALKSYVDFNRRMWDEHRFTWMFAPTLMLQKGTQGGPNTQTSNYQHNFLMVWQPVENTAWGTGQFVFNLLEVSQISSTTGVNLTTSLGINYAISDSVADSSTLKALYWQQAFPKDIGYLRFGHIELNGIVLNCRYACDDTQSFIAAPLSTNPSSTMSGQGWGVMGGVNIGTHIKLELGVTDGNGDGNLSSIGSVKSSELAYAGAISIVNLFPALGDGDIRIGHYSVDPLKQGTPGARAATRGTVIAVQQDIGDFGLFARYTEASGRQALSRHTGAIGAVWKNPFGNSEDWLGFGLGYAQPTAARFKKEKLAEVYYRMQMGSLTQFTIGAILLDRPNNVGNTGTGAVFNLRLRAQF